MITQAQFRTAMQNSSSGHPQTQVLLQAVISLLGETTQLKLELQALRGELKSARAGGDSRG